MPFKKKKIVGWVFWFFTLIPLFAGFFFLLKPGNVWLLGLFVFLPMALILFLLGYFKIKQSKQSSAA